MGGIYRTPPSPNEAIANGAYAMAMRLYRADRYGRKLDVLSDQRPVSGQIQFNDDNEFKRSLNLTIEDPDILTPFRDFIIPEITLATPLGAMRTKNLGHYMVTPPSKTTTTGRRSGQLEAKDITLLLARFEVRNFIAPVGTDVGLIAYQLGIAAGLLPNQLDIPVSTGVLTGLRFTPEPGTMTLALMNEFLNAGNCYQVWTNGDGVVKSMRYLDLGTARPVRTYSTEYGLEVLPPIDESPNWDAMRNRVTVRNIAADKPPIVATARITNRSHPLFYDPADPLAGFGIELSETVENTQVETVEAARALAESTLARSSSFYRKLQVRTIIDIDADGHDIIGLDLRNGREQLYSGNWWRRTWSIAVQGVAATMESELYRTEQWR